MYYFFSLSAPLHFSHFRHIFFLLSCAVFVAAGIWLKDRGDGAELGAWHVMFMRRLYPFRHAKCVLPRNPFYVNPQAQGQDRSRAWERKYQGKEKAGGEMGGKFRLFLFLLEGRRPGKTNRKRKWQTAATEMSTKQQNAFPPTAA